MFAVVFDACVLYPAPLRDLLMSLAQAGDIQQPPLFHARWTDQIHDEWTRNVVANRGDIPDIAERLKRTRQLMNEAISDCLVTGHESLISGLDLPDKDDRHILAAAIVAHASVIVTYNLKDFPADKLRPFGIQAEHPDEFISNLFELSPPTVAAQVKAIRARLKNPTVTVDELLEKYLAAGLPETVADLSTMKALL